MVRKWMFRLAVLTVTLATLITAAGNIGWPPQ
jgi:hypothetical protein